MGKSERKELTPNGAVVLAGDGGVQRMQPRAGGSRAISLGDGTSNGWVDVYVRCCSFLLKRTPAPVVHARGVMGANAGSDVERGTGSVGASGEKRFVWCSGATMPLRVVRCDAMRGCERCDRCEDGIDDECDVGCCGAVASVSVDTGWSAGGCGVDVGVDECPLGTGPLRVLGPAGPTSLFSRHSCSRERSVPVAHT